MNILEAMHRALDQANISLNDSDVCSHDEALRDLVRAGQALYDSLSTPITELVAKLDTEPAFPPVALYDHEGFGTHSVVREIPGARVRNDDDGNPVIRIATCGHCGARWNDAAVSHLTPVPSGRCPFEYEHTYDDSQEN